MLEIAVVSINIFSIRMNGQCGLLRLVPRRVRSAIQRIDNIYAKTKASE